MSIRRSGAGGPASDALGFRESENAVASFADKVYVLLLLCLALFASPLLAADVPADGLKTEALTISFTETAFLGLNRADVEAGYKVLAQTVGQRRGYRIIPKLQAFRGAADLDALLKDETVRMLVVNAWVFMDIDTKRLTPMFIGSAANEVGRTYVLITRRDSGLDTLADLRGKELTIFELANATLGRYWIETRVMENGFGAPRDFFARTEFVLKPSAAVLPVFFGKKLACVVDRSGFDLMVEMNPQVGRELQVVAESDVLVDSVICLRNDGWPEGTYREDLKQTLGEFHREPAGAQILTMFKTDRLIPFREEHLAATRKLRAAYDRLRQELR